MRFGYSAKNLTPQERRTQRFFEILPGAVSWTILAGLFSMSLFSPVAAAIFVIAFLMYWIYRLLYMTVILLLSYFRLEAEKQTDWVSRIQKADELHHESNERDSAPKGVSLKDRLSHWIFKKEMTRCVRAGSLGPASKDLIHLVVVPIVGETREITEPGIKSLTKGTFPSRQMILVLALEERSPGRVKEDAENLRQAYSDEFRNILIFIHPAGISGEACVKGANTTYAAKEAKSYLDKHAIPYEHVIISCFDADTVVPPDYFACLTYQYLVEPKRERASFQPIPVFNNNIWETHGFTRVLEMGASFFQLIEATNPEKLVTFSSHSMSFKALVEIDYWPVDMISDDSAIFWKAFIHFDGDYRAVPLYVTLSMDVVDAGNWWKTAVSVYRQRRRWAWGVENFPILMRAFLKNKNISFYDKWRHAIKMFEGHVSWATWAIILTLIGWLPALYAGREFSETVLYYSAPRIAQLIFRLSTVVLVITIALSLLMLPKKRVKFPFLRRCLYAGQWLLLPWIFVFLSALPALDAQTRLMFGKYMEFQVTDKSRKKSIIRDPRIA
ncbi:MAG: glycosyltransferase family 2 protein [Candidatus Omnitrophota bacterium]|nr:glycosyltransferase family 2 protein [Candidatus Omnitrophota bacterium]